MIWLRLAVREIINNRKFAVFFCLNLALGLTSFVVLDAFKVSLQKELNSGSKGILGGDLSVRCRNRPCTEAEMNQVLGTLPDGTQTSQTISLFSMAATKTNSRLIQLIAKSDNHPLYGSIQLRHQGKLSPGTARLNESRIAWVYPELLIQLGVNVGDTLKIGETEFRIQDVVEQDSATGASAFGFAPRVYIGKTHLPDTKLIQPGSRYSDRHFYRLVNDESLDTLVQKLKDEIPSKDLRIRSHKDASENLARSLTYLTDYLGLVALVALFLAALGSAYLFRSYLLHRLKEIAVLMSLGSTALRAQMLFVLQLVLLGAASAIISLVLSWTLFPIVAQLSSGLLPIQFQPTLSMRVIAVAVVMGIFGSTLICLPLLARLRSIKPADLFHEFQALDTSAKPKHLILLVPVLAIYYTLAIWESNSFIVGSVFFGTFLGSALVFWLCSFGIFRLLESLSPKRVSLRFSLRQLSRNQVSSGSCFLAISLGALLTSLVPQIFGIVLEEISSPQGYELPELFLVDIQEDQLKPLKTFLQTKNAKLENISPLVRGRLLTINGEEIKKQERRSSGTREEDRERWARNRGQNITYGLEEKSSETIIRGKSFTTRYDWQQDEPVELSIEMRYADRLDVDLNDRLEFNVQGVRIEGKVVNIRRVQWTSFQPNFFIKMQPGVLDDAPKIFLASIPKSESIGKATLQNAIVEKFPNISVVDVATTIRRILVILEKMGWIVRVMAYFALFAGFIVLFSIANHQAFSRRWDTALLKVLGSNFKSIRAMMLIEFAILGFAAASIGTIASFGVSFAFSHIVFNSPWKLIWKTPTIAVLVITLISVLTALIATNRVLRQKPAMFLNNRQ